ncbi:hypothetical protein DE146DRAFT_666237 [Phaeosphaeria sp. MPI-PUGE-AT-0046c]|nr:hypothetical protein DE146DRAFT_666237 [Phaeosphaeria sp. MPI-PUGE-AT-0046c]
MASLRTLFLGVYASNGVIRALFLPICYILLLSPFLTLLGYYLGFGRTLRTYLPEDLAWTDLLPQVVLCTVVVFLPTRLLSGSKSKDGGQRRVQSLPYWIPGFKHFWSIVTGGESWLKGVRDSSIDNVVAYSTFGAKHNVIVNDKNVDGSLLSQISKKQGALEVPKSMKSAILHKAFGMSSKAESKYLEIEPEINKSIASNVHEQVQPLLASTLHTLSESLPDFVTFNSSIVDQMQWERVADVELTDGTSEAECSLFALVNEFCCNAILPTLMGAQFTESYQLLATDLASFNQRYWALALGLPRLSPIQGLPGAALAQKRLLQQLKKMFGELTYPPVRRVPEDDESVSGEETDADVVTPFMKLNDLFTKHDLDMPARASVALQFIHEIVAEVAPLVFWTLIQVHKISSTWELREDEKSPLEKVRHETRSWARAYQPPSIHPSFPSPPAISFDKTIDQNTALPYLHACIDESRRLYSCSNLTYLLTSPLTLSDPFVKNETWTLDAGTYLDVGLSQSLVNSNITTNLGGADYIPNPFTAKSTSATKPISPHPSSPSQAYISFLTASILAGIFQLWDIAPAPKKSLFEHMQEASKEAQIGASALAGEQKAARSSLVNERGENDGGKPRKKGVWKIPAKVEGASISVPRGDVRVRVRRREGLPEGKMVGR